MVEDEGEADPREKDPRAAHLGMRRRLARGKSQQQAVAGGGGSDEGGEEVTLAAAEHACLTPWSATRDTPEGEVVERMDGVRGRKFADGPLAVVVPNMASALPSCGFDPPQPTQTWENLQSSDCSCSSGTCNKFLSCGTSRGNHSETPVGVS